MLWDLARLSQETQVEEVPSTGGDTRRYMATLYYSLIFLLSGWRYGFRRLFPLAGFYQLADLSFDQISLEGA